MTTEELREIAEHCWEDCDGCTEQDKQIWVNGFVTGVLKFADVETLPSPTELEEIGQRMSEKFKRMVDIPSEFNQIISENFDYLTDRKEFPENKKKLSIELEEWTHSCSDGCCTNYGTTVRVDGTEMPLINQDPGTIVKQILEHLGYEVEIKETYDYDGEG